MSAPTGSTGSTGSTSSTARRRLPQSVVLLLGLAGAVVVIAGLKAFAATAGPLFLALVLVLCVSPVQSWLRRRRVPGWVGVIALLAILYLSVFGLAAAVGWSVARLATLLSGYGDRFASLRDEFIDLVARFGVTQSQISDAIGNIQPSRLISVGESLLGGVTSGLQAFLFILLLLFFLVLDAAPFPVLLEQAAPRHRHLVTALRDFAAGTRRYLVVSTIFGAAVAVLDVIALYALSVPLPLLWGLLAFITNYIANIGFVLGLLPAALVALLANGPTSAIIVVVVYTVLNVVVQGMIQPKIAGNAVGLSASLTFLSVIFWGFALGSIGALLAVPLSLLARAVLIDADPSAHWLLPFVSGEPDEPDQPDGHLDSLEAGGTMES